MYFGFHNAKKAIAQQMRAISCESINSAHSKSSANSRESRENTPKRESQPIRQSDSQKPSFKKPSIPASSKRPILGQNNNSNIKNSELRSVFFKSTGIILKHFRPDAATCHRLFDGLEKTVTLRDRIQFFIAFEWAMAYSTYLYPISSFHTSLIQIPKKHA